MEQAEIAALEASKGVLEELKEAKEVQCAVVTALMMAVGDQRGKSTPPSSPGVKSGILRRYFS